METFEAQKTDIAKSFPIQKLFTEYQIIRDLMLGEKSKLMTFGKIYMIARMSIF